MPALDAVTVLMLAGVVAVLAFDFTNGFHDASNMLGTLIASRAMTPGQAVCLVGVFTFVGPVLGGTAVADTIGGFVDLDNQSRAVALGIVLSGLLGAIAWNLLTWRLAIPSSSSHALVGGLVGAVLVSAGAQDVHWGWTALWHGQLAGVSKLMVSLLVSPLIGLAAGYGLHRFAGLLLRRARPAVNDTLRHLQWLTASALAFSHGTNDGQKGMGVIALLLVLAGLRTQLQVPLWAIALSSLAMTGGTLIGGWRIVRTVGFGIYRLRPLHGFDAQLASSAVILGASAFGGPVSTTHVVSGAIMGVGASERPRAVHWMKAREILATWLLTLPGAALAGAGLCRLIRVLIAHDL